MDEHFDDDPLRRIAARLLRNPADQDDAVQEAWLTGLSTRTPVENPGGWMAGVVHIRALRVWEKRRRFADAQAALEPPPPPQDPAAVVDRALLREVLLESIARLPDTQARVVRLRFFEELGLAEIAERLERPMSTVRTQLSRGLAELRRLLDGRTGDRRLTAIALVRCFDLPHEALAVPAVKTGARGILLFALLAFGVILPLGLVFTELLSSEPQDESEPRVALLAEEAFDAGPAREDRRAIPAASQEQPAAGGSVDSGPQVSPPAAAAEPATMRVTIVGVDDAGLPVPDFRAKPWKPSDRQAALAGPAGPTGRLSFTVGEEHFWEWYREPIEGTANELMLTGGEYVRFAVECPRSVRLPNIEVPFVAGGEHEIVVAIDRQPLEFYGLVVDPDGRPIEGVTIRSFENWKRDEGDVRYELLDDHRQTEAEGRFAFLDKGVDELTLYLRKVGFVSRTVRVELGVDPDDVELILEPAIPVVGVARDTLGRPIEGARILSESLAQATEEWARTGADGSFRLDCLPAGLQRLWAYGPVGSDVENYTASIDLMFEGESVVWNPVLEESLSFLVDVVDPNGAPVEEQLLLLAAQGPHGSKGWWDVAVTDSDGRAHFPKVPDVDLRLDVRINSAPGRPSAVPLRCDFDLRPGPGPLLLRLEPHELMPGSVRGRTFDSAGRAIRGGDLLISGETLPIFEQCFKQGESFHLVGLPRGNFHLALSGPAYGYWRHSFRLDAGQDLDLGDLRLAEPGTLRVVNHWPGDDPEGATHLVFGVILDSPHGPMNMSIPTQPTERSGEFEFAPGALIVFVHRGTEGLQWRTVEVESGGLAELVLGPSLPAAPDAGD